MLIPGPSRTDTPAVRASRPSASPTECSRSASHEDPRAAAVGKQVAGRLLRKRKASASGASLRTPCGPSVRTIERIPSRGMAVVSQAPSPESRAAFSSRVGPAATAGAIASSCMAVPLSCWAASGRHHRPDARLQGRRSVGNARWYRALVRNTRRHEDSKILACNACVTRCVRRCAVAASRLAGRLLRGCVAGHVVRSPGWRHSVAVRVVARS